MYGKLKRVSVAMFTVLILLSFFACGTDENYKNMKKESNSGLAPELDFGGRTVRVLADTGDAVADLSGCEAFGETVNTAIFERNRDVEIELGVDIEVIPVDDAFDVIRRSVNSGTFGYDIVFSNAADMLSLYGDSYFYDLNGVQYLDTSAEWWDREFCEDAQLSGKLYSARGDISLSSLRSSYVTFFNASVTDEKTAEELKRSVIDGTFTVDKQNQLLAELYKDLNENSVVDREDLFGLGTNRRECADAYFGAFDIPVTERIDAVSLSVCSNSDLIMSAYEKIYELIITNPYTYITDGPEGLFDLAESFAGDKLAMATLEVSAAEDRTFGADAVILPLPKYSEDQNGYTTFSGTDYSVVMIPKSAESPECSGAVLSALCSRSMRDILPAYYGAVTGGRYSRDQETHTLVDLAVSHRYSDSAWIYSGYFDGAVKGIFSAQLESGELSNSAGYSVCINAILRRLPELNELFK